MRQDGIRIWQLLHDIFRLKAHKYSLEGLTELEARVMHIISVYRKKHEKDLNIAILKDVLNVSSPTISQVINTLEDKKYVVREKDVNDKRITRVILMDKGKQALDDAVKVVEKEFVELSEHLGDAESTHFVELLEKVVEYLEKGETK
jgi:DNA-binding MarR family transcriptional regulator